MMAMVAAAAAVKFIYDFNSNSISMMMAAVVHSGNDVIFGMVVVVGLKYCRKCGGGGGDIKSFRYTSMVMLSEY